MPRNTFILVSVLAVLAALVVGVNIGKKLSQPQITQIPPVTPQAKPSPIPTPQPLVYTNNQCGISFEYPANFIKQEATQSAGVIVVDPQKTTNVIIMACQKNIPRVPLGPEKIETIQIGSTAAKLYHDANAKDGTPVDKLIFRHPKNGLDIFLAGLGPTFQQAIASLKILQ